MCNFRSRSLTAKRELYEKVVWTYGMYKLEPNNWKSALVGCCITGSKRCAAQDHSERTFMSGENVQGLPGQTFDPKHFSNNPATGSSGELLPLLLMIRCAKTQFKDDGFSKWLLVELPYSCTKFQRIPACAWARLPVSYQFFFSLMSGYPQQWGASLSIKNILRFWKKTEATVLLGVKTSAISTLWPIFENVTSKKTLTCACLLCRNM